MKSHITFEDLYEYRMKRIDGFLRKKIEEHIKICEKCREELEELGKFLALLSKWEVPEYPSELDQMILNSIKIPERKTFRELIGKLFRPFYLKLPLTVLASVLLIFLAIFTYRNAFLLKEEKIPREFRISTHISEVKNPILIEVENREEAFSRIIQKIQSHGGRLVRRESIESGIKVVFFIEKESEEKLLKDISFLGRMQIEKEGYRDGEGNIVLIIRGEK